MIPFCSVAGHSRASEGARIIDQRAQRARKALRRVTREEPMSRREALIAAVLLGALAGGLFGSHIGQGGFYSDDWNLAYLYANPNSHGAIGIVKTFYAITPSRPVLSIYLPFTYAVFGMNPALHLLWITSLAVVASLLLFVTLRMLNLAPLHAWVISALALVFPFSDSTRLWATAGLNSFAVVLFLAGVPLALRALSKHGKRAIAFHLASVALYAAAIEAYDITTGLVLVTGAVYFQRARRPAIVRWGIDIVLAAALALLKRHQTHQYVQSFGEALHHGRLIWFQALDLFRRSLLPYGPHLSIRDTWVLLLVLLAASAAVMKARPDRRRIHLRRWLAVAIAGILTSVGGYLALIPAAGYYAPDLPGVGNRINVGAEIGFAILVYATIMLVAFLALDWTRRGRVAATALATAALMVVSIGFVKRTVSDASTWDSAAAAEQSVLSVLDRTVPNKGPKQTIYLWGHRTEAGEQIPIFDSTWDLIYALRLHWRSSTVSAFPMLTTTAFHCGTHVMYPSGGLYGSPSVRGAGASATYGAATFVDYASRRAMLVRTKADCVAEANRLLTPALFLATTPRTTQNGRVVRFSASLRQGINPIDAQPVTFKLGHGSKAQRCTAISLPSGLAVCDIGIAQPPGRREITATFAGNDTLRPSADHTYMVIR
jgi:hypothetical protein